jgi:sugar lactone lactonase YvrE
MSFSVRKIRRRYPSASRLAALTVLLFSAMVVAPPATAQGTHLWSQSRLEEFEKGTPEGVSLWSDGHLRAGPGLSELLTTPSTYIWSVAVDSGGVIYAGTASPATVLRVGADGKPFTLFESQDLSVQALRMGPDGALYAATLPSGKVYRLHPDATAKQDESSATEVFDASKLETGPDGAKSPEGKSESHSHYIWEMIFDAAGRLYIATGGPGAVYRITPQETRFQPNQRPELFFKSDEQHIRSLAWDAKGNLIAGSDGSGLVYRISPEGKGYVLFEAPRREITSVAVAADGTIYAACVGDKSRNPLPALTVQGVAALTITIAQPGSLQAANSSASVPEGSEIYALFPIPGGLAQAPRRLWADKEEIVYALAAQPDGLLVLSGNRGRILRILADGSYADIAHLEAQQGLTMAVTPGESPGALIIGTGNTGKIYRLAAAAEKHEFASDVLDAGALARFGRVEVEPGSAGYELWTRTGNVEQPARGRTDWGWSIWQPLSSGVVASPPGRYLQWKAVLHENGALGGVGMNYLPVNAAPVVDDVVVVPGARYNAQNLSQSQPQTLSIAFSTPGQGATVTYDPPAAASSPLQAVKDHTAVTVRWAAHDDNGDELTYALYLRGDGETIWRLLKDGLTDKAYSFDTALIPDGGYQLKVVASDAPSHTPGEALTGARTSDRFEVDTTPPAVSALQAEFRANLNQSRGNIAASTQILLSFAAEDSFSPIARAEYSLDGAPWQYIEPVGGLSDSKREHYEVLVPVPADSNIGEHLVTVRVYDRHDNVGVGKTVITTQKR